MEALTSLLKEMEARLQALQADLGKLKRQIRLLAEENERLRYELARAYGQEAGEGSLRGGLRNLWDLYQQGFHVCNVHFGRLRVQECLFCEAFWRRERSAAK